MTDTKSHAAATNTENRAPNRAPQWSVVIPAYNEEEFLGETLTAITSQTIGDAEIVLVDNASTDKTRAVMEAFAAKEAPRRVIVLSDDRPGKINALETGISAVETEYVALCDADTFYPPEYLERAGAMLGDETSGVAAAFAFGVYSDAGRWSAWWSRVQRAAAAALLPNQGHTGGYGHTFRTKALKDAGGYSAKLWPFMVADHEIVNRVAKLGNIAYSKDHWCLTSSRREGRGNVDWKLHERLLYNITPQSKKDWFFYEYLKPRFEERKFFNANLRQRDWEPPEH